jgi:hypothetical protein
VFSTYNPQTTSTETTALGHQSLSINNRFDSTRGVVVDSKDTGKVTSQSIKSNQPLSSESKKIQVFDSTESLTQTTKNQDLGLNQSLPHPQPFPSSTPKIDLRAQFVIRKHYAKTLVAYLSKVQQFSGEPQVANYVGPLLNSILVMRDTIPFDPYVEVTMAFYDAIAYKDGWANCRAEQYEGAKNLLSKLANKPSINRGDVDRGLDELEALGFDVLPFSDGFDLFDESESLQAIE